MKNITLSLFTLLSFITSGSIQAQTTSPTAPSDPANLQTVYSWAAKKDPAAMQNKYNLDVSKQLLPIAEADYLPTIAITGTKDHKKSKPGGNEVSTKSTTYAASITQNIFNLAAIKNIRSNAYAVKSAQHAYRAEQQAEIIKVSKAYITVLEDSAALRTLQAQEKALEANYKSIKAISKYTAVDKDNAKAQMYQAKAQTIAAESQLQADTNQLHALIGEHTITKLKDLDIDLTDILTPPSQEVLNNKKGAAKQNKITIPKLPTINKSINDLENQTEKNNETIKTQQQQVAADDEALSSADATWLPTLQASASYGRSNAAATGAPSGSYYNASEFKLTLNMTPFAGGKNIATRQQAKYQYLSDSQALDQAALTAKNDTINAFNTLEATAKKINADDKSLEASKTAYNAAFERDDLGIGTYLDVLNATQSLFTSAKNLHDDMYNYLITYLTLKQATGTLNPQDLETIDKVLTKTQDLPA
jgi:outer membrane protein